MKKITVFMTVVFFASMVSLYARQDTSDAAAKLAKQITSGMEEKRAKKIAIMPFVDIKGEESDLGKLLSEELVTRLFESRKFEVVERSMLSKIMEENKLSMSGVVDTSTAKQIGKITGVDAICTGTMTAVGNTIKINARLIMAETGSIASAASAVIDIDDSIRPLLSNNMLAASDRGQRQPSGTVRGNPAAPAGPGIQKRLNPPQPQSGAVEMPQLPRGIPTEQELYRFIQDGGELEKNFGERGSTPLHIAAIYGNMDLVRILVERKRANVNIHDKDPGATPLHDAVGYRRPEMVNYLINHGADVNAKDKSGATPLRVARKNQFVGIAQFLEKKGAKDEGPTE